MVLHAAGLEHERSHRLGVGVGGWSGGVGQDQRYGALRQVAAADQPLIVLLQQQHPGQSHQRGVVGGNPHHTRRPRPRRPRPTSSGPHRPRPRPGTTRRRLTLRPSPHRARGRRPSLGRGRSRPLPRQGSSRTVLMPATSRGGCWPSRSRLPTPRPSCAYSPPIRSGSARPPTWSAPTTASGSHPVPGPARPPRQRHLGRDPGRGPVSLLCSVNDAVKGWSLGERCSAVLGHRPTGVVRDLPGVAVGVDEDA